MKPKDTKRAIDQLIGDIQDNEWYCIQGDWEKELIVDGLKRLLEDYECFSKNTIDAMNYLNRKMKQPFVRNDGEWSDV